MFFLVDVNYKFLSCLLTWHSSLCATVFLQYTAHCAARAAILGRQGCSKSAWISLNFVVCLLDYICRRQNSRELNTFSKLFTILKFDLVKWPRFPRPFSLWHRCAYILCLPISSICLLIIKLIYISVANLFIWVDTHCPSLCPSEFDPKSSLPAITLSKSKWWDFSFLDLLLLTSMWSFPVFLFSLFSQLNRYFLLLPMKWSNNICL